MSKRKEIKRKACGACGKQLKIRDWYYRDSGYFCNNSCFEKAKEKAAKKA